MGSCFSPFWSEAGFQARCKYPGPDAYNLSAHPVHCASLPQSSTYICVQLHIFCSSQMPCSTLCDEENAFLSTYIDHWRTLNGVNVAHTQGGTKPKTLLLREICNEFYLKFPERDPHLSDANPLTFSDEDLALFPKVSIHTKASGLLTHS
jgi:hypothetical protein